MPYIYRDDGWQTRGDKEDRTTGEQIDKLTGACENSIEGGVSEKIYVTYLQAELGYRIPWGRGESESGNPAKIMKKVVIQSDDITTKQWANLILELNLMRKAWKPYARIQVLGRGVKQIVKNGTKRYKI